MRRRGTIQSRSGAFRIRYSLGSDPVTGKRRWVTATVQGTRKDAERELTRRLRTVDTGEHPEPSKMSVADWLVEFTYLVGRIRGFPRIRFHDLRHSQATQLLASGVHPKVVQERLGHSTIAVTMDIYSHVTPGMQSEAVAKLDLAFGDHFGDQRPKIG